MGITKDTVIAILCASAGLGTYAPAVDLFQHLHQKNISTTFEVLESNFTEERRMRVKKARQRWQENFELALMAQRFLTIDNLTKDIDPERIENLFERWTRLGVSCFVLLSGFWLPILDQYLNKTARSVSIECIQMDASMGHSWMRYIHSFHHPFQMRWLFSTETNAVLRTIIPTVPRTPRGPHSGRSLVLHGGGWQIGDYRNSVLSLRAAGYQVFAALTEPSSSHLESGLAFAIDPSWEPWGSSEPLSVPHLVRDSGESKWRHADSEWLTRCIQDSAAIVSKPGGGTLLDSLKYATPIIFCTPYGEIEKRNADLWIRNGFGISLSDWKQQKYSESLLEVFTTNLVKCQKTLQPSVLELLYE